MGELDFLINLLPDRIRKIPTHMVSGSKRSKLLFVVHNSCLLVDVYLFTISIVCVTRGKSGWYSIWNTISR